MAKLGYTWYPQDWWTSDTFKRLKRFPIVRYTIRELFDLMYKEGGPVDMNRDFLEDDFNIKLSDKEFEKLMEYVEVGDDGRWWIPSIKNRISRAKSARENGRKGGRPKGSKNKEITDSEKTQKPNEKTQDNNPRKPKEKTQETHLYKEKEKLKEKEKKINKKKPEVSSSISSNKNQPDKNPSGENLNNPKKIDDLSPGVLYNVEQITKIYLQDERLCKAVISEPRNKIRDLDNLRRRLKEFMDDLAQKGRFSMTPPEFTEYFLNWHKYRMKNPEADLTEKSSEYKIPVTE